MFLLLTRILLWAAVIVGIGYLVTKIVPKPYVTYVGYSIAALLLVFTFFEPTDGTTLAAWQFFSLPFKPVGIVTILLVNIVLRGDLKSPETRKQLTTMSIVLLLCSLSYFPRAFCQTVVERDAYALQQAAISDPPGIPQAIVLLGWQSTDPHPISDRSARLSDKGDLILHTANLYLQRQAPRVIISAGPRYDYTGPGNPPIEARSISLLLQRLGVPEGDIIIDNEGMDIRSSARNVTRLMDRFGIPKDIILVTTAISSYRALETFYEFDAVVAPRPAAYRTAQPYQGFIPLPKGRELIPTVEGLQFSTVLIDEFLNSIYYFLRGWLSPGDLLTNRLRRAALPSPAPSLAATNVAATETR